MGKLRGPEIEYCWNTGLYFTINTKVDGGYSHKARLLFELQDVDKNRIEDTFEEVVFSTTPSMLSVDDFLQALSNKIPNIRTKILSVKKDKTGYDLL